MRTSFFTIISFALFRPHPNDLLLPMEKLDIESMMRHDFIAGSGSLHYLPYTITYSKRKHLKVTTIERIIILPAPLLNLVGKGNLSVLEAKLDTLGEQPGPDSRGHDEEYGGGFVHPPEIPSFVYPDPGYAGPSRSSSTTADAEYDNIRHNPPSWGDYSPWD